MKHRPLSDLFKNHQRIHDEVLYPLIIFSPKSISLQFPFQINYPSFDSSSFIPTSTKIHTHKVYGHFSSLLPQCHCISSVPHHYDCIAPVGFSITRLVSRPKPFSIMQSERTFHKENQQKQNQEKIKQNSLDLYSGRREQQHFKGSSEHSGYISNSSPDV